MLRRKHRMKLWKTTMTTCSNKRKVPRDKSQRKCLETCRFHWQCAYTWRSETRPKKGCRRPYWKWKTKECRMECITDQVLLLHFFAQIIIRLLKFDSSRISTKLNTYEILKRTTGISNPNDMWDVWKLLLMSVIDKKSFPWIIIELLRKIHKRDFLKTKAASINNPLIWKPGADPGFFQRGGCKYESSR